MNNATPQEDESISGWLNGIKEGDSDCAYNLYREIFPDLVQMADRKLKGQGRWRDGEDVASSVLRIFVDGARNGKFPTLENSDDLWKILTTITSRKVRDYLRRRQVNVAGESALGTPADSDMLIGMDAQASDDAGPVVMAMVHENCKKMLDLLGDPTLAQIAIWKMERFTHAEIAEKLGVVEGTVERKVGRIRRIWAALE